MNYVYLDAATCLRAFHWIFSPRRLQYLKVYLAGNSTINGLSWYDYIIKNGDFLTNKVTLRLPWTLVGGRGGVGGCSDVNRIKPALDKIWLRVVVNEVMNLLIPQQQEFWPPFSTVPWNNLVLSSVISLQCIKTFFGTVSWNDYHSANKITGVLISR